MEIWQLVIIYGFVTWAVFTDIRTREISNVLVGSLILVGAVSSIFTGGFIFSLVSFLVTTVFALALYKSGMFGGGDLKLFIALSVISGMEWTFGVFFYSLLVAIPLFAYYMIKEKTWKPCVPYAVAILGGVIWQNISPLT